MKTSRILTLCQLVVFALIASGAAIADKPDWAGNGKHGKNRDRDDDRYEERRGDSRRDDYRGDYRNGGLTVSIRFGDSDRRVVQDYYGNQGRSGHCPPGLAKKNNGCMPPGQAKKWSRGSPLPRDLHYYDLPRDLLVRLPVPPSGQRYVRIAGDILLIAVGTNMVLDAIEDLGR